MKTAMQELIDEMTTYLDLHESQEVKEVLRILKASAIRKYWKKEKEQIINAHTNAYLIGETAMQKLITELKYVEEWPMMSGVIKKAEELLEKEKEQIINAYDRGLCDDEPLDGKEYYNQTYNQK